MPENKSGRNARASSFATFVLRLHTAVRLRQVEKDTAAAAWVRGEGEHLARRNLQISDISLLPVAPQALETPRTFFELGVYPNLAGRYFRLKIHASESALARMDIRNMLGVSIFEKSLDLQKGVNTVPAGNYRHCRRDSISSAYTRLSG